MMNRRQFLLGAVGTACALPLYAWGVEPRWVDFTQLTMPVRRLPPALQGRTLVQMSDLHVGDYFDWRMLRRPLRRVQEMAPDYVVYTGDFVTYETDRQLAQLREFAPDLALGRLGTAAVLGNHDYGHGWRDERVAADVAAILTDAGVTVLRNTAVSFDNLTIAGIDDYWSPRYAPQPLLASLSTQQPTVVLCHNPDVADQRVWGDYRGWILSGHTHGGQCKPPFLPPPLLPVENKRYTAGRFDVGDGRSLYINRGLGHLWQVRFNARPEVTTFSLAAA